VTIQVSAEMLGASSGDLPEEPLTDTGKTSLIAKGRTADVQITTFALGYSQLRMRSVNISYHDMFGNLYRTVYNSHFDRPE
jgi:hypothetical protein